jgi:prepilin-type N-terminal cleavage/methylation domain-containing protein
MRTHPSAAAGYTLLEVLITLVIIGLISGLLFAGLGGAARQSLALADKAGRLERAALTSDWWRVGVDSILPAGKGDPVTLSGTPTSLTANMAQTLHARPGSPRLVTWSIVKIGNGATLHYSGDDTQWDLARTQNKDARFAYLTEAGEWKSSWAEPNPPRLIALLDFFDAPILATPRSKIAPLEPRPLSDLETIN